MRLLADISVAVVALLHFYFLVLEMFFWNKPLGLRSFRMTQEVADASALLAKNQGLYNGFLSAGLFWGLWATDSHGTSIKIFFLVCATVAGLYGGLTAHRKIILVQALPAAVALALMSF